MRLAIVGVLTMFLGASGGQAPAPAGQPAQPPVRRALPQVTQDYISVDAPVVVLQQLRVIDGTGSPAVEDQTIVIQGADIKAIGPSASKDCAGRDSFAKTKGCSRTESSQNRFASRTW